MISSAKTRSHIANTIIYIVLTVLSVIWLLPIAWLLISSFRGEGNAWVDYVVPKEFTFGNYIRLFTETDLFNYPRWFGNTVLVAIASCALSTVFVLMTAFVLSRMRFKLRKPIMNVVLILGMFPGFMSMIAIYYILKLFGLGQTLVALVLVYSGGAGMQYYIAKGFFDTIPKELDEAAMLDGATKNRIFWQMTLPLSKPIIIYTVLTTFMAPWVDFIFVSVIMKDNYNNYTIALGLWKMLERETLSEWYTRFCAGAILVAIPITLLFIFMQKYYVSGVTGGAVKG